MENNPFAALFPSADQAQQFSLRNKGQADEAKGKVISCIHIYDYVTL